MIPLRVRAALPAWLRDELIVGMACYLNREVKPFYREPALCVLRKLQPAEMLSQAASPS
jgi:hypothetical protein